MQMDRKGVIKNAKCAHVLAKAVKRELEENVVDVDCNTLVCNSVKVVRDDLGLLHKHVTCVIYAD